MAAATRKRAKAHLDNDKMSKVSTLKILYTEMDKNAQACPSPVIVLIWEMHKYSGV